MDTSKYRFRKLIDEDPIPFDLLLLADESKEAIEKYVYGCDVYILYFGENAYPIGVLALCRLNVHQIEIKNIAITELFRGQGAGSFLIREVKEIARRENCNEIIVGTADGGLRQIHFYEMNEFRRYSIKENFFIENYSEPIVEDGIMLKDMIMLKLEIR